MDHYLDIRVLPDPEFAQNVLLGALVSKLHRGLVAIESDNIGISFPQHAMQPRTLGDLLRLHGPLDRLNGLMQAGWLKGMNDHIDLHEIKGIPDSVGHRVVRRRQFKTNADRLRRRRMKRKNETWEQAAEHIPDQVERRVNTPFVMVRSSSSGKAFPLFVEHCEAQSTPVPGSFSTYGLSQGATVPWF